MSSLSVSDLTGLQPARSPFERRPRPASASAEILPLPVAPAAGARAKPAPWLKTPRQDAVCAGLVLVATLFAGALFVPGPVFPHLSGALVVAAVALGLVYAVDGFAENAFATHGELARALLGAALAASAIVLALSRLRPDSFSPLFAAALVAAIPLCGHLVRGSAVVSARRGARRMRAIVLTHNEDRAAFDVQRLDERIDVLGRVSLSVQGQKLKSILAFHQPDLVLVDAPLSDLEFDLLRLCSERRIRVLVLQCPLYGLAATGPIVRLGGRPWMPLRPLALAPRHRRAKRALDLVLVVLAAPFVLPVMAVVAVAVASTSRGGVLYRQTRLGEGGRPFVMLKFRTMRADAEQETGPVLARREDDRVTRVGRLLRPTRLDEFPQLWNIVRGEMSLVGPRPERPEFAAAFNSIPEYGNRHLLRPGLTGLAQLVGGYDATAADKVRCDLLYVSSRSLRLDLRLIGATALDLVRGFPSG